MDDNMDLFSAIKKGVDDVRAVLDNGADVNSSEDTSDKDPALAVAVKTGNYDVVKLLLDRGADKDAKNTWYVTVLDSAVEKGSKNIVKLLLDYGADVKKASDFIVCEAAKSNDVELVELLLEAGAKIKGRFDDETPLHVAAYNGNEKLVNLLLDHGADINAMDENCSSVLSLAARSMEGDVKLVKLLLDRGASILGDNCLGESVLHAAIWRERVETIKLILSYKEARLLLFAPYKGKCPLLTALSAEKVYEEIIQILLDHGANVHDTTHDNETTTLQFAARTGDEKIFQMILDRGVQPLEVNSNGKTTLHFAAEGANEKIVRFLLDKGASVRDTDKDGNTSLYYAAYGGNEEIVRLFLELGVDVNGANKKTGETALHICSQFGFANIVKLLLQHNSNIEAIHTYPDEPSSYHRANKQIKAINLAVEGLRREECVKVLLDYGADVDEISDNDFEVCPVLLAIDSLPRNTTVDYNYLQMKKTTTLEQLANFGANLDGFVFCDSGLGCSGDKYRYCAELLIPYVKDINAQDFEEALEGKLRRRSFNNSLHCAKTLIHHLVILDSQKLDEIIASNDDLKNYKRDCEEELEKLKAETFGEALISYYDFLTTRDHNQLASYLRNDTIARAFTSETYKTTFPIYQLALHSQFRRGMWRKLMLDRVKRFFHAVADYEGNGHLPKLPWTCTQQILFQLSNKDLRMLIQVCNPKDGFNIYNVE